MELTNEDIQLMAGLLKSELQPISNRLGNLESQVKSTERILKNEIQKSENLILDEVERVHNILDKRQNDTTKHTAKKEAAVSRIFYLLKGQLYYLVLTFLF